jgi:hypothetical protein
MDMVPKTIMHFLVNFAKGALSTGITINRIFIYFLLPNRKPSKRACLTTLQGQFHGYVSVSFFWMLGFWTNLLFFSMPS